MGVNNSCLDVRFHHGHFGTYHPFNRLQDFTNGVMLLLFVGIYSSFGGSVKKEGGRAFEDVVAQRPTHFISSECIPPCDTTELYQSKLVGVSKITPATFQRKGGL